MQLCSHHKLYIFHGEAFIDASHLLKCQDVTPWSHEWPSDRIFHSYIERLSFTTHRLHLSPLLSLLGGICLVDDIVDNVLKNEVDS